MKHLLNTLFITTQGAYCHREGTTVLVEVEKQVRLQLPIHTLCGLVCFGNVLCSPGLYELCCEHGVAISFLSEQGKFIARVEGPISGNVLLRQAQYRIVDNPGRTAKLARLFVIGKIANCRAVLLRCARENYDEHSEASARLYAGAECLKQIVRTLRDGLDVDTIRGKEGQAGHVYFGVFNDLITMQKDSFVFAGRTRRPPLDIVNAMLSFVYTLLAHDVRGALEAVGLDPQAGLLHTLRPGRPSLALDVMEELRPVLADRLVLSLINLQQVKALNFTKSESGAVIMDDAARKTVLVAWQNRKQEEITHPFLKEKIKVGLIPFVQSQLLARCLRSEQSLYPPFVWK